MKVQLAAIAAALSLTTLTGCGQNENAEKPQAASTPSSAAEAPKSNQENKPSKVALHQGSDEILLELLDSSDYPILEDIYRSSSAQKPYCPESNECTQFVYKAWEDDLKAPANRENLDLAARKSYAAALEGQAPHTQQEISRKAFTTRYAQLQELLVGKSVCFFYRPWKVEFLNDKYHLSGGNGKHTSVRLNLRSAGNFEARVIPGDDTYIIEDDKLFAPIPAQTFGDENYKKFSSYAEKQLESRPALKFCGTPMAEYNNFISSLKKQVTPKNTIGAPPEAPPELIAPQPVTNLFKISKPIEVVQPPSMQKIDVIPMEWFVPAQ